MLRSFPPNFIHANRFYGENKLQFDKPVLRGSFALAHSHAMMIKSGTLSGVAASA